MVMDIGAWAFRCRQEFSSISFPQKRDNFRYLAEDVTIVDERMAYSCPYTQSFLNEDLFIETLVVDKK